MPHRWIFYLKFSICSFSPTRPLWAELVLESPFPSGCVSAPSGAVFSEALRSHHQFQASHWSIVLLWYNLVHIIFFGRMVLSGKHKYILVQMGTFCYCVPLWHLHSQKVVNKCPNKFPLYLIRPRFWLDSCGVSTDDIETADGKLSASSYRHSPKSSIPVTLPKLRTDSNKSKT